MLIILMMIIPRPQEIKRIKESKKWTLVYGRRKTGKTFLVRQFVPFDEYFFVKTSKSIINKENTSISYDVFLEILKRTLQEEKTVVVDEFHRLGQDFFDTLHALNKQGKVILISSTLYLSKKLLSSKSALLGLFAEIPISLISLRDTLRAIASLNKEKKESLELALVLREPLAVDYYEEKKPVREITATILASSLKTIPALIGEIFSEEAREISGAYEGILRSVALGKVTSGEISNYLFSKKLIAKDDPSIPQQYLNNLLSFGILKRIGVFNKKKFIYKHVSPLAKLFYYADEKYNIAERLIDEKQVAPIIAELMPRLIEDAVREMLAERSGLRESILEAADYDVDGCLLKFQKPQIALEVKWKSIDAEDIKKSEETLSRIDAPQKILFVPDKKGIRSKLKVMDVGDLL